MSDSLPPGSTSPASLELTTKRLELFLSHSAADHDAVALVRRQIEALGVDVYLAEHDPQPGTSIAAKVERAIARCHAVVVLITNNSVDSAFVQQEVGMARNAGKPLIPIVEKNVDKSRLGLLVETEWLELDMTRPTEALAKVTASLQTFVRPPATSQTVVVQTRPRDPAEMLLLLGLGLVIGLLIASIARQGTT